jgi:cytochrome c biogenesis protein CcmG, thiol:disulfide interchange protein DsbE
LRAAAKSDSRGLASAGRAAGRRSAACHLLLVTLLLGICFATGGRAASAADSLLNKKAPQFSRTDLNGQTLDLASFRGKVVLLDFWATWCAPCQVEMPRFAQWQRQYGPQGLQVIGISMDDEPAPARRLYLKLKLNYPVAMGDEKLGGLYGGVLGLPLIYLIDRDGTVRAKFQGETDPKIIETQLKALLAQP